MTPIQETFHSLGAEHLELKDQTAYKKALVKLTDDELELLRIILNGEYFDGHTTGVNSVSDDYNP